MLPAIKKIFWFFGLGIFLAALFLPGYTKMQELRDKNTDLEGKIKRLRMENALLAEEIRRLDTDPTYQEKMVRDKMGIVRKGEVPVKVIQQERK